MFSHVNELLIILDAIDKSNSNKISFVAYKKTMRLPTRVLIKCNVLVELYLGNYNTKYGLVNGVDGI